MDTALIGLGTAQKWMGGADEAFAIDLIARAIVAGYRFIDTAYVYETEKIVGKAVQQAIKAGVAREDIFIQTKFYPVMPYDGGTLKNQFAESMDNLGLDYVDAYLIHQPVPRYSEKDYTQRNISVWHEMETLVHEKRVRHIGVSNFLERHLLQIEEACEITPEINQLEINPQFQQIGLSNWCKQKGMQVQGWGSLSVTDENTKQVLEEIARAHHSTWAQVALKWNVQLGNTPICSSSCLEHLIDNLNLDFALTKDDMEKLSGCNSAVLHRRTWWYPRQQMY